MTITASKNKPRIDRMKLKILNFSGGNLTCMGLFGSDPAGSCVRREPIEGTKVPKIDQVIMKLLISLTGRVGSLDQQ